MREVDYLKSLLAQERGCAECWKGVACGKDCHMLDVAALPQPGDLLAEAVRACEELKVNDWDNCWSTDIVKRCIAAIEALRANGGQ